MTRSRSIARSQGSSQRDFAPVRDSTSCRRRWQRQPCGNHPLDFMRWPSAAVGRWVRIQGSARCSRSVVRCPLGCWFYRVHRTSAGTSATQREPGWLGTRHGCKQRYDSLWNRSSKLRRLGAPTSSLLAKPQTPVGVEYIILHGATGGYLSTRSNRHGGMGMGPTPLECRERLHSHQRIVVIPADQREGLGREGNPPHATFISCLAHLVAVLAFCPPPPPPRLSRSPFLPLTPLSRQSRLKLAWATGSVRNSPGVSSRINSLRHPRLD